MPKVKAPSPVPMVIGRGRACAELVSVWSSHSWSGRGEIMSLHPFTKTEVIEFIQFIY